MDILDWWAEVNGNSLMQGDYLEDCPVPIISKSFDPSPGKTSEISIEEKNIIIMTQSCDLANNKAEAIALCPIYTLEEWSNINVKYKKNDNLNQVRRGQVEGLHMLAGFDGIEDNLSSILVDFRQIHSLPIFFLKKFAQDTGQRKRLNSPYLEHLAQAFARFFMRVGLPSSIKEFK